jgi:hypothetical protein
MDQNRINALALIMTAFATNESWTVEKATELSVNSMLQLKIPLAEIKEANEQMIKQLGVKK